LTEPTVDHHGALYDLEGAILEPKPSKAVDVYMGGESPAGARGDRRARRRVRHARRPAEVIADRVRRISELREQAGKPPLRFGVSGYVIVRDTEAEAAGGAGPGARRAVQPGGVRVVPGLREGLAAGVGAVAAGIQRVQPGAAGRAGRHAGAGRRPDPAYEQAGAGLMLLQFSPQAEEMARFGAQVIPLFR
jgi:FMNH2-dependent dimethyl sulfone monooxygenase